MLKRSDRGTEVGRIEVTAFARRGVFLAVMVWFGYFEFPLGMVPFTAETSRKYRLTTSDELGLQN